MLVPVCDQVSAADDQDETHEGRASGEARTMTLAKAIGFDHDARNADQNRHGAERAELVDGVEGRVHVLGQHRSANRQPDRQGKVRDIYDFGDRLLIVATAPPYRRGITQKEAARRIGVDSGTLARWERGEREPTGAHGARALRFLTSAEATWSSAAVRTA